MGGVPVEQSDGTAVPATLCYDVRDPYAVALTFRPAEGPVRWLLAREMLVRGLAGPAGVGAVRVWPALDAQLHPSVVIDLRSPDGRLSVRVSAPAVERFLARTIAIVPIGDEGLHLDAELAALLGTSDAE
ncbi:MAG: SsgA family sporulation/cell division regulator [Actinobacteria bacterium]|nr:SsgA family sporulation/cell division regulator [Actinomycetota bacterium]